MFLQYFNAVDHSLVRSRFTPSLQHHHLTSETLVSGALKNTLLALPFTDGVPFSSPPADQRDAPLQAHHRSDSGFRPRGYHSYLYYRHRNHHFYPQTDEMLSFEYIIVVMTPPVHRTESVIIGATCTLIGNCSCFSKSDAKSSQRLPLLSLPLVERKQALLLRSSQWLERLPDATRIVIRSPMTKVRRTESRHKKISYKRDVLIHLRLGSTIRLPTPPPGATNPGLANPTLKYKSSPLLVGVNFLSQSGLLNTTSRSVVTIFEPGPVISGVRGSIDGSGP